MSDIREKRDLVLAPGTYAYMQDATKGLIKVYTGPTVINQTAQDIPVAFDEASGTFKPCARLEDAVKKSPIAVEGDYLILKNPGGKNEHPEEGSQRQPPELLVGRKINIPGPCMFALWPSQEAETVRGHHLRSNQYLLVRIYNEEEASANWSKAVIKTASSETPVPAPTDLTVGRLFVIKGTEVSFYIPPTGVQVVPDENNLHVREALTLERLEYCILVDEDGTKRYERGPQVVFPEPTERFIQDRDGNLKFRAIELNEIQGLHIKVIAPYKEGAKEYKEGDEIFITGKETAIYFPREQHSLVSYDGKSKHFASAIPVGEARYVMNRKTGQMRMVRGPAMLLPNPVEEVIVRRWLTDKECQTWYPGNQEVLEYNRSLRQIALNVPTTRQGVVSEGDYERGRQKKDRTQSMPAGAGQSAQGLQAMEKSMVSQSTPAMLADQFSRASTYSQPRTITLNTKYEGVPGINVWTGYAVLVVSKAGKRRVEQGPTTILLEYDETVEVLQLSTGRPKTSDRKIETVYLRVKNNHVGDVIEVETADHVRCTIELTYRVNFGGDPMKWFEVENYVKFLCDHTRSLLKGAAKKVKVEDFYANYVDFIRNTLLGVAVQPASGSTERGPRPGLRFDENGMLITDIEILNVSIGDDRIGALLNSAQHQVVQSNILLSQAQRNLEVVKKQEEIAREEAEAKSTTSKRKLELDAEEVRNQLTVVLAKISSEFQQHEDRKKSETAKQEGLTLAHNAHLGRERAVADQAESIAKSRQERELAYLKAEVDAVVKRFAAAQGGFSEALLALGNHETLVKVAEAMSVQNFIGGKNLTDVVDRVFAGTPLEKLMERVKSKTTTNGSNGDVKTLPPAPTAPAK